MTNRWAATVPRTQRDAVARLWPFAVEVCATESCLWLRGNEYSEALDCVLRAILGCGRYPCVVDGWGVATGQRLPSVRLPEIGWTPLDAWLIPRLPQAGLGSVGHRQVEIQLIRATTERTVNALLVSLESWSRYAETAPRARLERLMFAVHREHGVLVRGEPLPPIRAVPLVDCEGVIVPAGWTWWPQLEARLFRRVLGLVEDEAAMLHLDGSYEVISSDAFCAGDAGVDSPDRE